MSQICDTQRREEDAGGMSTKKKTLVGVKRWDVYFLFFHCHRVHNSSIQQFITSYTCYSMSYLSSQKISCILSDRFFFPVLFFVGVSYHIIPVSFTTAVSQKLASMYYLIGSFFSVVLRHYWCAPPNTPFFHLLPNDEKGRGWRRRT